MFDAEIDNAANGGTMKLTKLAVVTLNDNKVI
jgi:hypothetical protein